MESKRLLLILVGAFIFKLLFVSAFAFGFYLLMGYLIDNSREPLFSDYWKLGGAFELGSDDLFYQTTYDEQENVEYSYYPINSLNLNISSSDEDSGTVAFVKVSLYLVYQLGDQQIENEISLREREIINAIINTIGRQRYEDIDTPEEREENLKQELIEEINSLMNDPESILDIFFSEFKITVI